MTYNHKEAFALMWYACKDCGYRERVWNSRDGVTPFGFRCTSCGKTAYHVDWESDECRPDHKPVAGQRFWRDGTPDEAAQIMRKRVQQMKGTKYECDSIKEETLVQAARHGETGEFQKGWPQLDVQP